MLHCQGTVGFAALMPVALQSFSVAEFLVEAFTWHCWALELSFLPPLVVLLAKPAVNHPFPSLLPSPGLADKELSLSGTSECFVVSSQLPLHPTM